MNDLENRLNRFVKEGFLLVGSKKEIDSGFIIPNDKGNIYATNNYEIAMLKAMIQNYKHTLNYKWQISKKNPLVFLLYTLDEKRIADKGFVYTVDKKDFKNKPLFSWQYVANKEIPLIDKIEITKQDFTVPYYYEDSEIWIPKKS